MPLALTPRLLRQGLELFAVISLIGVLLVLVFFGENLQGFLSGLANLRWGWMLLGLRLASMDWIGGGTRLWVMRRAGVRLPEAMTSTFMTFVATVIFFAVAGPLAIYLGAGKSLAEHNVVLGITYYGLFRASLRIFGVIGVVMLVTMIRPTWARDAVHWLATRLERRSHRVAVRIEQLREGIDRAHECLVLFGNPRGWLADRKSV